MTRGRRSTWARPGLEWLEARTLLAGHTLATATPLPLPAATAEDVLATAGQEDWYRLDLLGGRLTAHLDPVAGSAAGLRLRLLRLDGQVLAESAGNASGALPEIDQHLDAGRFFLVVTARSGGQYRLTAEAVDASQPFSPIPVGRNPT